MAKKKQQVKTSKREGKSMPRSSKKRKINGAESLVPRLPDDVFPLIISFCSVRDLLRVASSSKLLLNLVSYEHVLQSILCERGGNARKTVEIILTLLKKKQIFMPSPMRLLRLCNGWRCEHCLRRIYKIQPHFGVYMCFSCERHVMSTAVSTRTKRFQSNEILHNKVNDDRTAMDYYGSSKHFIWTHAYFTVGGERAGPIVTWEVLQSTLSLDAHFEALGDMVATEEAVQNLEDMFDPVNKKAQKKEASETRERDERLETYRSKKRARCERIVEQIQEMLEEPWSEFALQKREHRCWNDRHLISFKQEIVATLLKPVMIAPSKATKKNLNAVANRINEMYALLYSKGVPDLSFLDANHPFDSSLKTYLRRKCPTPADVLKGIKVGDLSNENLLSYCLVDYRVANVILEAAGIVIRNDHENRLVRESLRYKVLARKLWIRTSFDVSRDYKLKPLTIKEARTRFDVALAEFHQLKPKLDEYFGST